MLVYLRRSALIYLLIFSFACSLVAPLMAQSNESFAQKHATATAVVAGAGTTYLLKRSAKYKKEHGERLTLAEKHPYLSGFGVAIITHHVLNKKHHE
jgi:hypothetical protein